MSQLKKIDCKSEDVGILESNSFNVANIDSLEGDLKSLVERRAVLGPCYRLFYQKPLHLVRGKGTRVLSMPTVAEYLDMYNDVPRWVMANRQLPRRLLVSCNC